MGWFATVIVGLIAGWLASIILKTRTGLITELILGVIGGFLGGWLSTVLLGQNLMSGINFTSILTALAGAVVVILLYRVIFQRRR
jgi:uncharacterized membrane protein YeaQ/YmgE (transglycosylase-associated protein family)